MATDLECTNLVEIDTSFQITEERPASPTEVKFSFGWKVLKNRTKKEKLFIVLFGIIIFLSIILMIQFLSAKPGIQILHVRSHSEGEVCLTPDCIKTAAQMISSMNLTADPCDDFYQYSCGGWVAENPVPDGKSIWGTFGKLEEKNQLVIRNILEENPSTELKSEAEKKAKMYYESCMDPNEIIEKLGAKPMLDLLKEIGGWNISGPFNIKSWSLQKSLHKLHNEYNMGGLFSWAVGEDDKNSSRYVIQIDQGGLTLPTRDNYLNKSGNKKVLEAYLEYMTETGVALGGKPALTRKQMKDVIEFETLLAEITKPDEELRDEMKVYHLMSLHELQSLAPFMDWEAYFQDAFKRVNITINPEDKIVVHAPEYLERMSDVVINHMKSDEGKTTVSNYLVWQTVRSLALCLPKVFRDAYKVLRRALVGSDGGEESWAACVTDTNNVMGFAVGAMFVRKVFPANSKLAAEDMINAIRAAFLENLRNLDWMDSRTKAAAINKAKRISDMIGFPKFIMNPEELNEKYKDLEIKSNEYFLNNIRVNQFNLRKNLEKLDKTVEKTRWDMAPSTVNAYYAPTKNQMVFPAGILRPPFYDVTHSKSLNFGAMGVVMGHELTHAFDDLGRMYDQYGNLHKWWKNETIEKFKTKTECIVKQYGNYKVNGVRVNGRQTLGENIADNGGLKSAYRAYEKISLKEKELPLPGLNLTHKQLFFVSFAQVWCSASTPEAALLQVERDPHTPNTYRVIGPLSNMKEFAEVFHCPLGSKMNPENKCVIW